MKRWIPLIAFVLLVSAVPAFADHCAYCDFDETCGFGATIGGVSCRIHNPGTEFQWCEERGFCNDWGQAAENRSFNANWKVTTVRVLTANGVDVPHRANAQTVTATLNAAPPAQR